MRGVTDLADPQSGTVHAACNIYPRYAPTRGRLDSKDEHDKQRRDL
jgi:hypothetical protein